MWGPFEFLYYVSRELLVHKKWPVCLGAYPGFIFTLEAGFIGKASVGKLSRYGQMSESGSPGGIPGPVIAILHPILQTHEPLWLSFF